MPKVLLAAPGADWATYDVWRGIFGALQRAGVPVVQYSLGPRIQAAAGYMDWLYKHLKAQGSTMTPPTEGDKLYLASQGILEMALSHGVDWILAVSGTYLHPRALWLLRQAGLKLAIILTESPYDPYERNIAQYANVIFTNERAAVKGFSDLAPTYYFQHAMNPDTHHSESRDDDMDSLAEVPRHDVVFVGTGFIERVQMLTAVNWTGIDFGLYGTWSLVGSRSKLRQYIRGGITDNRLTAALYRRAKIGLNLHRTSKTWGRNVEHISYAESMNPRCYELAATGRFFLSDYRAELGEIFGDAVPTFTTAEELEALIRRYVADEPARQVAAQRLPELVKPHTFDARIGNVLEILRKHTQ